MSTLRYLVLTLALFTALTAVMTYPQALHLTDTVHDDGDPLLNAWAIAWVAHQLPIAPARVFDANIFYPERRTLAYSETLLLPSTVAAPLAWAGAGTILIYNLVFLSGFVISGVGVALLVRSLTGSGAAGVLGGFVFAFLPYRIDHFPHVQLQQTQCLPFAFWAFHRLMHSGRVRDGALFGAFVAGQILSCVYYGLFLVPFMTVICGALLVADGRLPRSRFLALVVAALVIVVLVLPDGRAYLDARKIVGERGQDEVAAASATLGNYLGPPEANALYGKLLHRFTNSERRLFPGFVAIVLAIAAFVPRRRTSDENGQRTLAIRIAYGLGLLAALDMSLGFNGLTYGWLYEHITPFRALRIPARMGVMVGFALAVLAGFGALRVTSSLRGSTRRVALCALGLLMLVEYASKPLDLRRIPPPPESYQDIVRDVGDNPTAPIFEFPASPFDDPTYMYYSTFHWQYLINGYSGFFPPSYNRLLGALGSFPDDVSLAAIKARGARYLVVHGERLFGARYEELLPELAKRSDLTLISRRPAVGPDGHREVAVYRVNLQ